MSTVSGLSHLEGETINVLADGCVVENLLVEEGKITLNHPASKIVAGLPYEFEMETLNLEGENTHGLSKIINEINISVDKSREDFFVVGTDNSMIQNVRSINSVNDSNYLHSGNISTFAFTDYTQAAKVHIKQIYPLPLTVNAISIDVTVADQNA